MFKRPPYLDGTLIRSDLLLETLLLLIKRNPLYLFLLPLWLLRGKAVLKAEIASRVTLKPAALPYNKEFVEWLRSERTAQRSIWLCTAASEPLARAVAEHRSLVDDITSIGDLQRLTNLVVGDQDRDAATLELANDSLDTLKSNSSDYVCRN